MKGDIGMSRPVASSNDGVFHRPTLTNSALEVFSYSKGRNPSNLAQKSRTQEIQIACLVICFFMLTLSACQDKIGGIFHSTPQELIAGNEYIGLCSNSAVRELLRIDDCDLIGKRGCLLLTEYEFLEKKSIHGESAARPLYVWVVEQDDEPRKYRSESFQRHKDDYLVFGNPVDEMTQIAAVFEEYITWSIQPISLEPKGSKKLPSKTEALIADALSSDSLQSLLSERMLHGCLITPDDPAMAVFWSYIYGRGFTDVAETGEYIDVGRVGYLQKLIELASEDTTR